MQRPVSVFSHRTSAIVFVLLIVTLAPWLGAGQYAFAQPSPAASETSNVEPDVISVDIVELPAVGTSTDPYILYLMQVTFDPGVYPTEPHQHEGAFVLTVDSGAVCYEVDTVDTGTTLTARLSSTTASNSACGETPNPACADDILTGAYECTLAAGDVIYLPTGSSITQEVTTIDSGARHTYGNVDAIPAVVYLAGYEKVTPGAGCAGGCF